MKEFGATFSLNYLNKFAVTKEVNEANRKQAVQLKELSFLKMNFKKEEEKVEVKIHAPEDAKKDKNNDGELDKIQLDIENEQEEADRLKQELKLLDHQYKSHESEIEQRDAHSRPEKKQGCKCVIF